MHHLCTYLSPLGELTLAADDEGLIGVWFEGQKYFASTLSERYSTAKTPLLGQAVAWLDRYFAGTEPGPIPPLHLQGTPFRLAVWAMLRRIPYGMTTTYGRLARLLARSQGLPTISAQAIGNAIGHNPVSIFIPCHRVVGHNGDPTGYAGGLDRKKALLELEHSAARARTLFPETEAGANS